MSLPHHWLDTRPGEQPSINDRAYCYGDSLFETLRVAQGRFHWLSLHLQRLAKGAALLGIPFPGDSIQQHIDLASDWLQRQSIEDAVVRITLSRGAGARGYGAQPDKPSVALALSEPSLAWRETAASARLVQCDLIIPAQPRLAGIKHGNRLEQVLAAREVAEQGADEGLMVGSDGNLVSAVSANLFAVIEDNLLTPPVADAGIAGIVRALILDQLAAEAGLRASEAPLLPADLAQANEVFLTNSLVGVRSVSAIPGGRFTSTQVADTLRALFFDRSELHAE